MKEAQPTPSGPRKPQDNPGSLFYSGKTAEPSAVPAKPKKPEQKINARGKVVWE